MCLSSENAKCLHTLCHHQCGTQLWEHEYRLTNKHQLLCSVSSCFFPTQQGQGRKKERKEIWPVRGLPLLRQHSSHSPAWHRRWLPWLYCNCTSKGFTPRATEGNRKEYNFYFLSTTRVGCKCTGFI